MKIGIIVHSETGNTFSVAQKLKDRLTAGGHSVNMERISSEAIPDIHPFDAVVFACPVQGASISQVLKACLSQIASLENKKVSCLVTEYFPFAWMGGNRAIAQMAKLCESKGAKISDTGVVNWTGGNREKKIDDVVEKLYRQYE